MLFFCQATPAGYTPDLDLWAFFNKKNTLKKLTCLLAILELSAYSDRLASEWLLVSEQKMLGSLNTVDKLMHVDGQSAVAAIVFSS